MVSKQANKANNENQDAKSTTISDTPKTSITPKFLHAINMIADALRDKEAIERLDRLKQHVPMLREFKQHIVICDYPYPIALIKYFASINLFIDTNSVEPLCQISELGDNYSRGIRILLRHELEHERTGRLKAFVHRSSELEAAAGLSAIRERGLDDLVDCLAILWIITTDQFKPESHNCDMRKFVTKGCLDHWAVGRWHDEKFVKAVSKIYEPAKEVASQIPTDYDRIVELVRQRASEITEALTRSCSPQ